VRRTAHSKTFFAFSILGLGSLVWFLALRTVVHFDEHKKEKW